MTERGAELLNRGRRSAKSSHEAWEDIKSRNEEIDWDSDEMIAERERRLERAFVAIEERAAPEHAPDGRSDDQTQR